MKKSIITVVAMLLVAAMVLGACVQKVEPTPAPAAPTTAPVVAPTEAPAAAPTEAPAAPTEAPKVEAKVLKIGQIGMMSGAMALYGQQQQRGFALGLEIGRAHV